MSKANQKFVQADEAVSPVIGVILMVAITVVLAAVVFVLVSNLSKTSDKGEEAQVTITSPSSNDIYITLVKMGQNGPYEAGTEVQITVDGVSCTIANFAGSSVGISMTENSQGTAQEWGVGESVKINNVDCAGATLVSGSTHLVSVTLHGTLLQDNAKVIIQ